MKGTNPRRSFLGNALKTVTGLVLLSSTATLKAVAGEIDKQEGYNPYAPTQQDIRKDPFGKHVKIQGKIFDSQGKSTMENVKVEVWHLSPDSKKYGHRSKLYTDANGEYRLLTDVPERAYGESRKIHFKITKGDASYTTALALNDWGAYISGKHWEENQALKEALLFPQFEKIQNTTTINFNISLNN